MRVSLLSWNLYSVHGWPLPCPIGQWYGINYSSDKGTNDMAVRVRGHDSRPRMLAV
jgi:hypothetical protein